MKIGLVGDIHGRVFHTIAMLTEWQLRNGYPAACEKLSRLTPGEVDLLITHDAPYGVGTSFHGETQGSARLTELVGKIEPRYWIGGHYHHVIGPRQYGRTTYLGLNVLVDLRNDGERRRVQPGSIAVLDTATDELGPVTDDWLAAIDKDFEFADYMERRIKRKRDD